MAIEIIGRVIDRQTHQGMLGVRVEAWGKELTANELITSLTTNERGAFEMRFDESRLRQSELYFKVFREGELLRSTEDSVLWRRGELPTDIVIEVADKSDL